MRIHPVIEYEKIKIGSILQFDDDEGFILQVVVTSVNHPITRDADIIARFLNSTQDSEEMAAKKENAWSIVTWPTAWKIVGHERYISTDIYEQLEQALKEQNNIC